MSEGQYKDPSRPFKRPADPIGAECNIGRLGKLDSVDQCNTQCASEMPWQNPRDLIDQKIDRLNREVNELYALRRALPGEMSPQAERSLVAILNRAFALDRVGL